jgi:membrane dipeptidase
MLKQVQHDDRKMRCFRLNNEMKKGIKMAKRVFVSLALLLASPALAATPEETARAALATMPIIDGHNDTPEQIRELFKNDFSKFDLNSLPPEVIAKTHTSILKLRQGKVGAQFWSVWIDPALPKHEAVTQTLEQIDTVERMIARYPETFTAARTATEIEAAIKRGRIASLIGMEGGHSIGNSLGILRQMYRAGARYMTITHFLTNDWADSATDAPRHDGLTSFGVVVIKEMNRLGMMIDISHVAETTMGDVFNATKAPVILSHSNTQARLDHPRNMSDAMLIRLNQNGGVIMITFVPDYTSPAIREWENSHAAEAARMKVKHIGNPKAETEGLEAWIKANPRPRATLAQVADHIDHARDVAGIDHIGIGGDFGGISSVVEGLEDVSTYPALFTELARRGYTQEDLEKIAGRNILRVIKAVEAVAATLKAAPPSDATIGK